MKVSIYLDDGRIHSYEVADSDKAREHATGIVKGGWRFNPDGEDWFEHYPPHRILKVKVEGVVPTNYPAHKTGT